MEMRAGFKKTEIGVIPEDWEALPASAIGAFRGGSGFPLDAQGDRRGDYPFFKVSDMNHEGNETFMSIANHYISEHTRKRLGATAFPPESIVFAKVGAAVFLERKKILSQPSCIDNNMAALVLDKHCADSRYVHSLLLSKKLGDLVATTALPALNGKVLGSMVLAIPPLPEQRAIATALSDVDALLGGLDRLIAKKRDLKQAAMQQLLTGQTRLPGFHGEWEVRSLDMVTSRTTGVWGSNLLDERNRRRAEIIRAGDISPDGRLTATATRYVSPDEFEKAKCVFDDLVITTSGNGLGKLWWCDGRSDVAASNFVRVLHPKITRAVGRFLYYALRTCEGARQLQENTATSAYPNLRPTYFSTAWIPMPAPAEQAAIAAVLSGMDAEIAALEARREKTRALKQGMMQELLTGRTRLV